MGLCIYKRTPRRRTRLADSGSVVHRRRQAALDALPWPVRMLRMAPRASLAPDYWLYVLCHEMMHAAGQNLGTFRTGPHPYTQTTRFTLMTDSSESEERVAELGAELLTARLGLTVGDDWRDNIGHPTDDEVEEATRRVEYILSLS